MSGLGDAAAPALPIALVRNERELDRMRAVADGADDGPVLMVNVNRYRADSGYPSGQPYQLYMAGLEKLVGSLGGRIAWRTPVLGQPVGGEDPAHEILVIWYPSHRAFLDLPHAPGGQENYDLRGRCVEAATVHRCPGDACD